MLIWISSNAELGPIFALLKAQSLKGFAVLLSIVSALLSIYWFCIFRFLLFFQPTDDLLMHVKISVPIC